MEYNIGENTGFKSHVATSNKGKKSKLSRRRLFDDEENRSPVLGLRILPVDGSNNILAPTKSLSQGYQNSQPIIIPAKEQRKSSMNAKFTCKLCQNSFTEPLQLANHKCVRIENVQYDCPECEKSFSCPANLASHRRWHKPKKPKVENEKCRDEDDNIECTSKQNIGNSKTSTKMGAPSAANLQVSKDISNMNKGSKKSQMLYECSLCGKQFRCRAYLKNHAAGKHGKSLDCNDLILSNANRCERDYKNDKPITRQNESNLFPSNAAGANFCNSEFGGLEALAYAAEMHSRLSPEYRITDIWNNPPYYLENNYNTITTTVTNKRKSPTLMEEGLNADKVPKLDSQINDKVFTLKKQPLSNWLPPSPPQSDLSSSPKSIVSEESDEKYQQIYQQYENNPMVKTKEDISRNPLGKSEFIKQVVVKPTPRKSTEKEVGSNVNSVGLYNPQTSTAHNLQYPVHSEHISLVFPTENSSTNIHRAENTALKFHEPYHPYIYNPTRTIFNSETSQTQWNTWVPPHATNYWKNQPRNSHESHPYFYHSLMHRS
uniref:uncharacterized protein LOC120326068 n=1 Tax=Styela clava TaxID=7725 RepID=UPI0019394E00|nr:uncharacterized protein LOC120326068 [Styela clava]